MSDALSTPPSLWERVIDVFDPAEPADAALRAPRDNYNPVSENIVKRLRTRLPHQKFALAGGIGSGKTTELRATLQRIATQKVVVFLDLLAHFERGLGGVPALNRLKVGELIGLLGLAVARLAEDDALPGTTPSVLISDLQDALTALNRAAHGPSAPALSVPELAQSVALLVGGLSGAAAGAALTGGVGAVPGALGRIHRREGRLVELGLKTLKAAKDTFGWRVGAVAPRPRRSRGHRPGGAAGHQRPARRSSGCAPAETSCSVIDGPRSGRRRDLSNLGLWSSLRSSRSCAATWWSVCSSGCSSSTAAA
ncbi:MAG: hypothetical protein IPI35_27410 [Deltaproteobacteria bacterium]|nr:hypothetical protein [Deltaproteobacteria bacterium]